MATIVDRHLAVRLLTEEFAALDELYSGLADDQWDLPTPLPGWSVRDQLTHLLGTEASLLGEPMPDVDVSGYEHLRNPIAQANEVWVESLRGAAPTDVLARWRDVTGRRLEALGAMTQADFDAPSWTPAGPDETYGRFMRIRHYDCFVHEHDARAVVGAPDRDDPDHVRSALDEVATGLGYIVGRKAGLPVGSRVRIDVTGAVADTWFVEIPERAQVVDALAGEPSVSIALPVMLWLRLTAGREDATPHLGSTIELGGDEDLARQLATHLAFTI